MLLQNLRNIKLICLKLSFTGSQFICLDSFCPICALLFKSRQNCMHLFWAICNFDFNLLSWGTKLNKHNQIKAVLESCKAIYEEAETRTSFFLYKNLSLLFYL